MHTNLVKISDRFDLHNWNQSDDITKQVFFWLPELSDIIGKTHCLLNLSWPNEKTIIETPLNYDTYIISFHLEYVDYDWIERFVKHVGSAKVILINQFQTLPINLQNKITLITYDIWPTIIDLYQKNFNLPDLSNSKRSRKISALANRVCQARAYVCAYIYRTWDQKDYIMSWRKDIIAQKDLYLLDYTGNERIDSIIDYIRSVFFDIRLVPSGQDIFKNTPLDNLFYDWSAYNDCVINLTNESINCSHVFYNGVSQILPGPYLTEKTMKCLLSSTAILPVGQYHSYQYLKEMGFLFDYPWNKSFDSESRDIQRFSMILDVIDSIQRMELEDIFQQCKMSNQYNLHHIKSGKYRQAVEMALEKNIEKFINENR